MKRITYDGETFVTGNALAAALVEYAKHVVASAASVTVEIPVVGENGAVSQYTILIGPATQLVIQESGGADFENEDSQFPVPTFPSAGNKGVPANLDLPTEFPTS